MLKFLELNKGEICEANFIPPTNGAIRVMIKCLKELNQGLHSSLTGLVVSVITLPLTPIKLNSVLGFH